LVGGTNSDNPKDGFALVLKACELLDYSSWVEPEALNNSMEDLNLGYNQSPHVDTPHYHQWSDVAPASSTSKPPAYSDLLPTHESLEIGSKSMLPSNAWPQSITSTGGDFPYGVPNLPQASDGGLAVSANTNTISYEHAHQRSNQQIQDVEAVSGSVTRTPQRRRNVLQRIRKMKTDGNLRGKSRERAAGESYMDFD
jgi:hypothetical protein